MSVLMLGGYGLFGSAVAERLAADASTTSLIIAGRSPDRAREAADRLGDKVRAARCDASPATGSPVGAATR